jgi:polysaccharide biosynthesis protein PslH
VRTVVVTKFVPLPANSGGKQRSLATLRRLASRGETVLCAFEDDHADIEGLAALGVKVRSVPRPVGPLAALRGLAPTQSLTAARFWDRGLAETVRAAATEAPTDLLYVNYAQLAPYASGVPARRRVLDLHNVESALMASYRRSASGPRRLVASVEAAALRRLERRSFADFDHVVVVSESDRVRLPAPPRDVVVCPNGWETGSPLPPSDEAVACFVALMSWAPNEEAAHWLAGSVWPEIRRAVPGAELLLVGRDPSEALRALSSHDVTVTGSVDSIAPYLARSRVALAPLRAGGGSRLKILEALDAGRPVVATSIGVEGLEDLVGRGVVVADTPAAMAEAVSALLADPAEAERLGSLGNAAVAAGYAWDKTFEPLLDRLVATI